MVNRFKEGHFYQHMDIKNDILKYTIDNKEGKIVGELRIDKNEILVAFKLNGQLKD